MIHRQRARSPASETDWAAPAWEDELALLRLELETEFGEFPVSHTDPDGACAIANLANWLGKICGDYSLKPRAFAAATNVPGVNYGWSEGVFYVQGPLGPQYSAHDPWGDLRAQLLITGAVGSAKSRWYDKWDGCYRQPWAVEIAKGLLITRERALACAERRNR